jgi:hypothetical protein
LDIAPNHRAPIYRVRLASPRLGSDISFSERRSTNGLAEAFCSFLSHCPIYTRRCIRDASDPLIDRQRSFDRAPMEVRLSIVRGVSHDCFSCNQPAPPFPFFSPPHDRELVFSTQNPNLSEHLFAVLFGSIAHYFTLIMTEIEKGHVIEDEPEDDISDLRSSIQLGGTEADQHDMRTLGRIQQLNVRISHRGCLFDSKRPSN